MTDGSTRRPLLAIVGPTATGKSDLAVSLARRVDGAIVNADAFQLYRGMDIGTAKLSRAARAGVPHFQLDVLDVRDTATVAAYQRDSRADVARIEASGRPALLVGGSGLYVRAALDHLEIPPTDAQLRARLEDELSRDGVAALWERLRQRDPSAAAAIQPNNARRLVRALEVVELTRRPFSATLPIRRYLRPTILVGLRSGRDVLDERIAQRAQRMWRGGLPQEVAALVEAGLREGRTAKTAVGYREALEYLEGALSESEAIAATIAATRRLARRQESWFRSDPRIVWLPADSTDLVDEVLALWERGVPAGSAAPSMSAENG